MLREALFNALPSIYPVLLLIGLRSHFSCFPRKQGTL